MTILILTMNMLFLFMNHPMSMGLILLIQTMMVSLSSGMMMKTFWLSYILMITMLSGMLVLFIYMSSVASNEKFKTSMKLWMYSMFSIPMLLLFLLFLNKMIINNNYLSVEMMNMKMYEIYFLTKMFSSENLMITIMMVSYLFLTMIVSSYLVNISEGPMRMKI